MGRGRADRRRAESAAVGAHDLAIGFGDTGSVGIGGITLGGGVGYLVRKYGLTIDSLLAARDRDRRRRAPRTSTPSTTPTCSGRSAAAAATSASSPGSSYRLHRGRPDRRRDADPAGDRGDVAGFIAAAEAAPEELSTIANVMPCPPMPFVPAEHHGEARRSWRSWPTPATPRPAERAIAPFRALATPLADMRPGRCAYPEIYPPEDPDYHPTAVVADDVHRPRRPARSRR